MLESGMRTLQRWQRRYLPSEKPCCAWSLGTIFFPKLPSIQQINFYDCAVKKSTHQRQSKGARATRRVRLGDLARTRCCWQWLWVRMPFSWRRRWDFFNHFTLIFLRRDFWRQKSRYVHPSSVWWRHPRCHLGMNAHSMGVGNSPSITTLLAG